ncbi:MAG: DUF2213 domain-containing protein [Bacteroidetes bacterium]|nr:DUF2213 domain-containing protein [Bacteroidota bacterium]
MEKKDTKPKVVRRYDYSIISDSRVDPSTGFLVLPARATRTGVFKYRMSDGSVFKELRLPEEVFAYESMKTFEGKPLTNGHPPELVTTKNSKKYMVGYTSDKVDKDGEWITTKAFVTDERTIKDIENGKQQLSCGYECELELKTGDYMGEGYDAIQKNIRYNHLAVVALARAGQNARLKLDSADGELVEEIKNIGKKDEKTISDKHIEKIPCEEVSKMVKIKINDVEYEVKPEAAKEIERLQNQTQSLQTKIDEKESNIKELTKTKDQIEAKADALQAELSSEKKKSSEKMDADEIKSAAKVRIGLLNVACKVCIDDNGSLFGIHGLRRFKEDFKEVLTTLREKEINILLGILFDQLLFISDERKRYFNFLTTIKDQIKYDLTNLLNIYKNLIYSWDIFRNLCYKCSISDNNNYLRLKEKIDTIYILEEEGLIELESILSHYKH